MPVGTQATVKALSPEDIIQFGSDIILGNKSARTSEDDITMFKSMGLSLEDISTANLIYQEALEKGIGRNFDFS